jgi:hypothetical protein
LIALLFALCAVCDSQREHSQPTRLCVLRALTLSQERDGNHKEIEAFKKKSKKSRKKAVPPTLTTGAPMIKTLAAFQEQVASQLQSGSVKSSISIQRFAAAMRKICLMSAKGQEDANELVTMIFLRLESEMGPSRWVSWKIPFALKRETYWRCVECDVEKHKWDAEVMLRVGVKPSTPHAIPLLELLIDDTNPKLMFTGTNKLSCETCCRETDAVNGYSTVEVGEFLIIHIGRWEHPTDLTAGRKLHTKVCAAA